MSTLSIFISRLINPTVSLLASVFFGLLVGWVLINYVTGCGEMAITMYGAHIPGHCVLYPFN